MHSVFVNSQSASLQHSRESQCSHVTDISQGASLQHSRVNVHMLSIFPRVHHCSVAERVNIYTLRIFPRVHHYCIAKRVNIYMLRVFPRVHRRDSHVMDISQGASLLHSKESQHLHATGISQGAS